MPATDMDTERLIRFAVDFAEMNLGKLRAGDRLNLFEDFERFFQGAWNAPEAAGFLPWFSKEQEPLSADDIRSLQRETKELLTAAVLFRTGQPLPRARKKKSLGMLDVQFRGAFRLMPGSRSVFLVGNGTEVFLSLVLLLTHKAEKLQIGVCPEDGRLFYRVRRQVFCSRRCAQNATKRAWRQRQNQKQKKGRKK